MKTRLIKSVYPVFLFFVGGSFVLLQAMPPKVFKKESPEKSTTTEYTEEQGRRITGSIDDNLLSEAERENILTAREDDKQPLIVTKEPLPVCRGDLLNSSLQLCKALKEQVDQNELALMPYLTKFLNEELNSSEDYRLLQAEMAAQVIKDDRDVQEAIEEEKSMQSHSDAAVFLRLLLAKTKAPEIFFAEKLTIPITGETRSNDLLSGKQMLQVTLPLDDGRPIRIHKILHDSLSITRTEPWNSKNPDSPMVSVEGSLVLRDPIPQTFVICLNRFGARADKSTKNQKLISGLAESIILTDQDGRWISYEPIAVICHEGLSLENGHYLCFRKDQDGRHHYYLYSDTTVKGPYSLNGRLIQKSAYLIAYQRSLPPTPTQEEVTTHSGSKNWLSENDESSSNSEDESTDFWTQRHFAILSRQARKKSPSTWNKMLFNLMKWSIPFGGTEPLTEEAFDQEINEVIAEAEENLLYLREAREWLTKKIHYTISKELPLITEINPTRESKTGLTLSPWQPTAHYPYQHLRTIDFKAESNGLYWDQQRELYSQFAKETTDVKRRKKFEEARAACRQAKEEAQVTKKALEQLVLDIGSTEEISGYTSRRWDQFITHSLTSVDDFLGFKFELEEIERLSEDENVSYPHSPGFKLILPEAKKYFEKKWKGFVNAREQLIRSVVNSSSQNADYYAKQALNQCELFYNQFKKTPILGSQIGRLLIESHRNELTKLKQRAIEEQKKIKDTAYDADENNSIWIQEETPEESLKEQMAAQWQQVCKKSLELIDYLGQLSTQNVPQLWMQKILAAAGKKIGNFNLLAFYLPEHENRAVSETIAAELGNLWIGQNPILTIEINGSGMSFNQLMSTDQLRCYRSPTNKYKGVGSHASTGIQANFEWRNTCYEMWQGNGHLDIKHNLR